MIEELIRISEQQSYRMPSGLTRKQRRDWVRELITEKKKERKPSKRKNKENVASMPQ